MNAQARYCPISGLSDHDRLPWRFFGLMSSSDGHRRRYRLAPLTKFQD